MKIVISIFSFCAILNTVTATSPFNIPNAKLPNVKTDYPAQAPKLPKRYEFTSKNNDIKKPVKESNLANLLKGRPLAKTNDFKTDVAKQDDNVTINMEIEGANLEKILYADEIERQTEKEVDKGTSGKAPEVVRKEESKSNFKNSDFIKKFSRNDEKNKIGLIMKPKVNDDGQLKPLELPPSMIPIFKPSPYIARGPVKNEKLEPISNILRPSIPTQESDTAKNNFPIHDANTSRPTLPVQAFISDTEEHVSPNQQLPTDVPKHTEEKINGNLNLITNAIKFNIPCQKASDILEDIPAKSELCIKTNLESKVKAVNTNLYDQKNDQDTEKLKTDDSVAIIFKPKNISLFNVYGDLLKKVTLTVLVPYHISKLGITP